MKTAIIVSKKYYSNAIFAIINLALMSQRMWKNHSTENNFI